MPLAGRLVGRDGFFCSHSGCVPPSSPDNLGKSRIFLNDKNVSKHPSCLPGHECVSSSSRRPGGTQWWTGILLRCVWAFRRQLIMWQMQPWRFDAFALLKHATGFRVFFFLAMKWGGLPMGPRPVHSMLHLLHVLTNTFTAAGFP